ncbi:MAG: YetF domain-containing protein [Nonlabens sp.]
MKSLIADIKIEELGKWLSTDWDTAIIIVLSVLMIFAVLIIYVRIAGLRTFAKMTSFDFATTVAIGSILASISINPGDTVGNGMVALAAIIGFQIVFALLQRRFKIFKKIATNKPVLIMHNGKILYDNLAKVNLIESELMSKLREANVLRINEVKAVVFESTGEVSVLHGSENDDVFVEDQLLDSVAS